MIDPNYVSIKEAVKATQVDYYKIWRLVISKKVPAIEVRRKGGRKVIWLVDLPKLNEFLNTLPKDIKTEFEKVDTSTLKRHNQTLVQFVLRRYQFNMNQFDKAEQEKIYIGNIDRAGGDVICEHCGNRYMDHPGIIDYTGLIVTCEWEVYKL